MMGGERVMVKGGGREGGRKVVKGYSQECELVNYK